MLTLGTGLGLNGKRVGGPWVPSDTPGTLLWLGSYDPANATLHTQPASIDDRGRFDADSGWTKGTGWSIANGVATHATGSVSYLSATGTACISGCRYSAQFDVARYVSGAFRLSLGGVLGTTRSAVGTYSDEATATSTSGLAVGAAIDGAYPEGDVDNVKSFTNKSIKAYVPKYRAAGLTGKLVQATAASMPWVAGNGIGFYLDAMAWDGSPSDFKCLTDGSGATVIACVTLNDLSFTGWNLIIRTGILDDATVGCMLTQGIDHPYVGHYVQVVISSGTGSYFNQLVSHTWTAGNTYVLTLRVASGTDGVTCRVNKVSKITGTFAAFSSANPTTDPMSVGSGSGSQNTRNDLYIANRVLTDAECAKIEDDMYLRATGSPMP